MKHIFCIHSNICIIAVFDIIEKSLEKGDKVVVLLTRNCSFDFFKEKVQIIDLQEKYKDYQTALGSLTSKSTYYSIGKYKKYLSQLKNDLYEIVGDDVYYFYTPNFGTSVAPILENKPNCIGYFFIEEGTLSYLDNKWLRNKWYSKKTKIGNVVRRLFGIKSYFQLTTTPKFKGTISLREDCFPWNKNTKIITSYESYLEKVNNDLEVPNNIILIGYTEYDISMVSNAIKVAINHMKLNSDNHISVSIKLHPQTYSYNPSYAELLQDMIKRTFADLIIKVLPASYPVELAIIKNGTTIYSLFAISSLCLYSVILQNSHTYIINNKGKDIIMEDISSLEDYMKSAYSFK